MKSLRPHGRVSDSARIHARKLPMSRTVQGAEFGTPGTSPRMSSGQIFHSGGLATRLHNLYKEEWYGRSVRG